MDAQFDSDYRQRILAVRFAPGSELREVGDLIRLKTRWLDALKTWHSPYKALIDCSELRVVAGASQQDALGCAWKRLERTLEGFYLRRACAFGGLAAPLATMTWVESRDQALTLLGVRSTTVGQPVDRSDVRRAMLIDNHFRQQTLELSFDPPVTFATAAEVKLLEGKLLNNLRLWHTGWNLLVCCDGAQLAAEARPAFEKMIQFFRGFFLQDVVGYGTTDRESWPFFVARSRHVAVARLPADGQVDSESAACASRKNQNK